MKVLVACEESQRVCSAFRAKGHEAYSCDVVDCSGGFPEWHIKFDVLPLLNGNCSFVTCDGVQHDIKCQWDLIIAHPPCTYLTVTGNRWFNVDRYGDKALQRIEKRKKAIDFFYQFVNANCSKICIENPVGIINSCYIRSWLLCYYCMPFYYSIVWLLFIFSFQLIHLILLLISVYILHSLTLLKSIFSHNYYLFLLLFASFWLYNLRW